MKPVLLLAILMLPLAACSRGPLVKAELDDEVRRLCAIDGGIKVYETVKLPPDIFNEWGQPAFRIPPKESLKPGDEYYYEWDIHYYRKGNPELSQDHFKLFRRHDAKLLGEAVSYGRGGGDLPSPAQGSSFTCPANANFMALKTKIFQFNQGARK